MIANWLRWMQDLGAVVDQCLEILQEGRFHDLNWPAARGPFEAAWGPSGRSVSGDRAVTCEVSVRGGRQGRINAEKSQVLPAISRLSSCDNA
jgi:hypothetical protein